jgi:hypothetical protein
MSDVYIYHFITPAGPDGESRMSARRATLEAIKSRGTPIMDTQVVVDHSEVDADGFLTATAANDSPALNDFAAQIASLNARAASRDGEAIANSNGADRYMLTLESRELRKQARNLNIERVELAASEARDRTDLGEFSQVRGLASQ